MFFFMSTITLTRKGSILGKKILSFSIWGLRLRLIPCMLISLNFFGTNILGKDLIKMSKDKIPQYHPSYTEEENKVVHDYLEHATAESLAQSIQDFCESYPGEVRESILENLNQLRKELSQRLNMEKRYKELVRCKEMWLQYRNTLETYPTVLKIREAYEAYKKSPGKRPYGITMREAFFAKYKGTVCDGYSEEVVRKMLLSEESARGIKRPKRPETFYRSVEEIPIESEIGKKEEGDVLESLGREELKHILTMLLSCADYEGTENPADVILLFLTRKYSHTAHMKKKSDSEQHFPQIASMSTYLEAVEKCNKLLEELKKLKVETKQLEKNI